ncbi:hypothetical protein HYALB_00012337 [Hymenoscyphus albidus]|uniref:Uncharacterized protein n=1 Tax=Hymenoscyphus albidus TaxID=595503 RepID=A0A9N9LKI0_9HELO|nr:hypothetical protein HYALB_00012337 [Hymenoscyphus albidus]
MPSSRKVCFSEHKLQSPEKKTVDITTLPSSENKPVFLDLDPDGICESPTELQPGERIEGRFLTVKSTNEREMSAGEGPENIAAIETPDIKLVTLQPPGPVSAGYSIKPKSRERNEGCKSMVRQLRNIGKENDNDPAMNVGNEKTSRGIDDTEVGKGRKESE